MSATDKARENRLRRIAERRGFRLHKSRRRDPFAADFGLFFISRNGVPALGGDRLARLDEVAAFLEGQAGAST